MLDTPQTPEQEALPSVKRALRHAIVRACLVSCRHERRFLRKVLRLNTRLAAVQPLSELALAWEYTMKQPELRDLSPADVEYIMGPPPGDDLDEVFA